MFGDLLPRIDTDSLGQALREVIAAPMANLTLALLLLAMTGLVLLVIVVTILFFLVGEGDEEEEESRGVVEPPVERPESAETIGSDRVAAAPPPSDGGGSLKVLAILGALLVPLLLVAAFVSAYAVTSADRYCLACHSPSEVDAGEPGAPVIPELHSKVSCVECHEAPLPRGVVPNSIERTRQVLAWVAGDRAPSGGTAHADRCLGCHESIQTTTVNADRGLRMSHTEPLAAGMMCAECHPDSGHYPGAVGPGMSSCLRCHDSKSVSGDCGVCHMGDPAMAAVNKRTFAASELVRDPGCGGCHNQKKCDACHGLRMPHTAAFVSGEHARQAAFGRKVVCMRCHTVWDCAECHQVPPDGGLYWGHGGGTRPSFWVQQHKVLPPGERTAGCGCHGRSPYAQRGDYCAACH